MTPPGNLPLGPSAERALAALETPGGKSRMERYLESALVPDGSAPLAVGDLYEALRELRRRQRPPGAMDSPAPDAVAAREAPAPR